MSPLPGGSTLITRAPKSASSVDANGPARAWERSSTVMSSSAIDIPGVPSSVHGDEEAAARLAVERLGAMPFAPRVLDEDDLAGADAACFAVARGDLHARVEIDDVLSPRGRGPVQVVVGRHLTEDDPRGGKGRRHPPRGRPLRGGGLAGPQAGLAARVGGQPEEIRGSPCLRASRRGGRAEDRRV